MSGPMKRNLAVDDEEDLVKLLATKSLRQGHPSDEVYSDLTPAYRLKESPLLGR